MGDNSDVKMLSSSDVNCRNGIAELIDLLRRERLRQWWPGQQAQSAGG
jgi:hypothetical protein